MGNDTDKIFSYVEKCFSKVTKEVINTMTGLNVEGVESIEPYMPSFSTDITGVMFINGKINAMVSLHISNECALQIVSNMVGIVKEELTIPEIQDGIGEIVNMITGNVKMKLVGTPYHFNLTLPFVVAGKNHIFSYRENIKKIRSIFQINNKPFVLEVVIF